MNAIQFTLAASAAVLSCLAIPFGASSQTPLEQSYRAGGLTIAAPWTRATPKGAPVAAGYVRITNTGEQADRLTSAAFDLSNRAEIHEMVMEGVTMRMRELASGIEIRPGQTVELKPGGLHLMFVDLKAPVATGKPVKGRLVFEKAGAVDVEFAVAPIGAASPNAQGGHGAGHGAGHGGAHGGHGR